MLCVLQRVSAARLSVDGVVRADVPPPGGLVVLAGLFTTDTDADLDWAAQKIANLRVFPDDAGKMNRSVIDIAGTIMLVPNFTLAGDTRQGRRPGFDAAMPPERAQPMFDRFAELVRAITPRVTTGVFRAHMHVELTNDGPVTLLVDSRQRPQA
jgi:D-aminoacyl-tRNA deacylase